MSVTRAVMIDDARFKLRFELIRILPVEFESCLLLSLGPNVIQLM